MELIYLANGTGIRAKLGFPKQFAYIGGKPLLVYGLEIFSRIKDIDRIIIPSTNTTNKKIEKIINDFEIKKCITVNGGNTRQESVYEGLKHVSSDFVLIGEAVRPFINGKFVKSIINTKGNVIPYMKLNSTPFNKKSGNILNRNDVVCVQTPQKYNTFDLIESHEIAIKEKIINCTDDLDLMKKVGICGEYTYIEGPIENIKITYPVDIEIADCLISARRSYE